jgi:hypothetical protein
MAITVRIPTPLRRLANGQGEVSVEAKNIRELIDALGSLLSWF